MHKIFFFEKIVWPPKTWKNVIFGLKNHEKMAHLVSTPQRIILHESLIAWNFCNQILKTMHKQFFLKNFFDPKNLEKRDFWAKKSWKNGSFGEHASTVNPT